MPAPTPAPVEADGTLNVPALTLPPSEFLSEEFKRAYIERLTVMRALPRPPALTAPKAEWDVFDAKLDELLASALDWERSQYPVDVKDTMLAGVRVGIVTPKEGIDQQNHARVLINLHAGGFIVSRGLIKGQVESIPLASLAKIKVITLDYRQAPYHRYPAATEDVEAVYRELLREYKPEAIGIFGNSAGGILAGQAVAWFQAKGLPAPGAVAMLSAAPGAFGKHGDSTLWGMAGVPNPNPSKVSVLAAYMQTADPADPKAYPESSDAVLARFPAVLLVSGTRSEEMSATIVAHARFLKLGVDSSLYLLEGGWHGAVESALKSPEGRDVNAYIARWFLQHLAR